MENVMEQGPRKWIIYMIFVLSFFDVSLVSAHRLFVGEGMFDLPTLWTIMVLSVLLNIFLGFVSLLFCATRFFQNQRQEALTYLGASGLAIVSAILVVLLDPSSWQV